jgi:lipid-A-disaccharide synthase-like uncharacterized protein
VSLLHAPLAFQVWDGIGWVGQGIFTFRVLHQWLASEKARRSVVPVGFWWWSLAATGLLLVYQGHRRDPVFVVGLLVNGAIYVRNLRMALRPPEARPPAAALAPVAWGLLAFGAVTALAVVAGHELRVDPSPAWTALGFAGQAVWSSRFVVQWWASERAGRSVLPPSFFWMSIVGALTLFAYAVRREDWVMMAAYALNPIPYARNLMLLRRERREPS